MASNPHKKHYAQDIKRRKKEEEKETAVEQTLKKRDQEPDPA
jgi:hypothetical protein